MSAIAPDAKPKLPRGVRLTHNEAQGGWVLLAPERVFKADAIAAEIVKRCTGAATVAEIVDDLAKTINARRDLVEITKAAHDAGLYTSLITSAVGITTETFGKLSDVGLDHVQISIQDNAPGNADHIAGYKGAYRRKEALAAEVIRLKTPLT